MPEDRNLLDYAYVLLKWRRLIVSSVVSVTVVAAGVSLVLPKQWTARTTLLPPEEEGTQLGLASMLTGKVPPNLGRLIGSASTSDRLLTILGSERVLGAVVDSFSLVGKYAVPTRNSAILELEEHVSRELEQDGTLKIEVTASSPELAAALANALAVEVDEVNRHYKSLQAKALREFLEKRVEVVDTELRQAGAKLRTFQEEHRLVDLDAQTNAVVDVIQSVAKELAMQQVELGVTRHLLEPGQEKRRLDELRTRELQRQLQRLMGEVRSASAAPKDGDGFGPVLLELPRLGQEYARLTLQLKLKEALASYLGTQLEGARYREARNTPTILVLDPATPPTVRSAPRRGLIVIGASAISLVCSVLLAFSLESFGRILAHGGARIQAIRTLFRNDA